MRNMACQQLEPVIWDQKKKKKVAPKMSRRMSSFCMQSPRPPVILIGESLHLSRIFF